ncbi:MAG: DUF3592 domain-containing protein [Patescibacteria group bacterium]
MASGKVTSNVFLGLGIVGIPLVVASAYFFVTTELFISHAAATQGQVTELIKHTSASAKGTYYSYVPHVSFTTPQGQPADFLSSAEGDPPLYHAGQRVPVLYDPQDPSHAKIDDFWGLWMYAFISGVVGVSFLSPALVAWILSKKKQA